MALTVTHIGGIANSGAGNFPFAAIAAVAAGDCLVVTGRFGPVTITVSDPVNGTYTLDKEAVQTNGAKIDAYSFKASAAASGLVVTVNLSASTSIFADLWQISGFGAGGAVVDQAAENNGTSTAPDSGAITTTAAVTALIGIIGCSNVASTIAWTDPNWTGATLEGGGNGESSVFQLPTSTGTFHAAGSLTPSNQWAAVIVAYAAAAAGGAALAATPNAGASVAADLTTAIPLAAAPAAGAAVAAALTTAIPLAAATTAGASLAAVLTTQIPLALSASAGATLTAALTTAITLGSALSAGATVTATLSGGSTIQASLAASAACSAQLTTAIALGATCPVLASCTATLTAAGAAYDADLAIGAGYAPTLELTAGFDADAGVGPAYAPTLEVDPAW